MNPPLLSLALVTAGLLSLARISHATVYTFDVDSSSGIGAGSFTIDLPDAWLGKIGETTFIPASSFHGSYKHADKWRSLAVALNELIEAPNNAELFGATKKKVSFKVPARGLALTPVEAVDNLPGVTLRSSRVKHGAVRHQEPSSRYAWVLLSRNYAVETTNEHESTRIHAGQNIVGEPAHHSRSVTAHSGDSGRSGGPTPI